MSTLKDLISKLTNLKPVRIRSRHSFRHLMVLLLFLALGGWLLRDAFLKPYPTSPPLLAFLFFGLALLLLIMDLTIPFRRERKRITRAPRKESAEPLDEISVLDWLKSITRWRPAAPTALDKVVTKSPVAIDKVGIPSLSFQGITTFLQLRNLRFLAAFILALYAQFGLDRHGENVSLFIVCYLLAAGLFGWAIYSNELDIDRPQKAKTKAKEIHIRTPYMVSAGIFSLITFLFSGGNRFTPTLLILWVGAIVSVVLAFWEGDIGFRALVEHLKTRFHPHNLFLRLDSWGLLWILIFVVAAFFRFAHLADVPYEMWSDHAEKLLDVMDVLQGKYSIYFPRNTGREAIQFYVAAASSQLFGTGISYLTLKISSALIGLLSLPYIYLFAREVGGRGVGLTAMFLAGVAYWPNTISRLGLRFPLFPLFTAAVLYHMVRGLRLKQRNQLLIAGLLAGLGLHGYSPARVIPFALMIGVGIYLLHRETRGERTQILGWLVAAVLITCIVFVPLFRIALEMPDIFLGRILTRLGTAERDYPGPPLEILISNVWRGFKMLNWDNGGIWVISIPHRPALDWVAGALFHLGIIFLVIRYIKERNWLDLFILIVVPILMLPSTLSLAFPDENPAPNRASGAIVPVFTVAAFPLMTILTWARTSWERIRGEVIGVVIVAGLFLLSARTNYRLVVEEYGPRLRQVTLNTSEIGHAIRGFAELVGSFETAHVVPYPHWVDTRLIGVTAGTPTKDYATWPENFGSLLTEERAQLFILHLEDGNSLNELKSLFPRGIISRWKSQVEGRDFIIYFVPPVSMEWSPLPESE